MYSSPLTCVLAACVTEPSRLHVRTETVFRVGLLHLSLESYLSKKLKSCEPIREQLSYSVSAIHAIMDNAADFMNMTLLIKRKSRVEKVVVHILLSLLSNLQSRVSRPLNTGSFPKRRVLAKRHISS